MNSSLQPKWKTLWLLVCKKPTSCMFEHLKIIRWTWKCWAWRIKQLSWLTKSRKNKSMNAILTTAIEQNDLQTHQVLLSSNALSRLNVIRLFVIRLIEPAFVKSLLDDNFQIKLEVICASNKNPNAVKLRATPMRDAFITDPDLKEAHRRVEYFLTVEFVTEIMKLEQTLVQHVLNRSTTDYRLLHEHQTTILTLMRDE